jgi:hypothetical protein
VTWNWLGREWFSEVALSHLFQALLKYLDSPSCALYRQPLFLYMAFSFLVRYWKTWMEPKSPADAIQGHEGQEHKTQAREMNTFEFLSLPSEIRNMIYCDSLVEKSINVTASTTQPGLLQVNRQIWREANLIYCKENSFHWNIWAFDATNYIAWCASSNERRCMRIF